MIACVYLGPVSLPLSATFHDNSSVISLESSTSEVYFTFQSAFVTVEASDREMILPVVLGITPPRTVGLLFPCVHCTQIDQRVASGQK